MRNEILKSLKKFTVVLAIGLLSAFVLSCGGSSGDGDNDSTSGNSQSLTITGESGNQVNLNGTWNSGCVADMEDGDSDISILTISGSTFSQNENQWLNSTTCSGISDITVTMKGNVSMGNAVTATLNGSNVTATEADVIMNTFEGTVNNSDVASDFNADQQCGFDDWAVGIPKDVIGTDCGPDSDIKEIFYIDDTGNHDVLYDGDDEEPVDVNGYPTEIDSDTAKERS